MFTASLQVGMVGDAQVSRCTNMTFDALAETDIYSADWQDELDGSVLRRLFR
jgi:hypothetical protein